VLPLAPAAEVPEIPAEPAAAAPALPALLGAGLVPSLLHDATRIIKLSGPSANKRLMA
jgi:hypothetical protein